MTPMLLLALAAFALLARKDHRKAFFLFCGLLPTYLIRFDLGGLPTTALEVIFAILLIAWLMKREKRLVDIRGWRLFMLAWIAVATVAVFVSPLAREAAGIWKAYFIEPAIFFIMANDLLRNETDRLNALAALAWSAIVIGVVTIIQRITGLGISPMYDGAPPAAGEVEAWRATAFYGYPNAIGLFLAPLIPLFWTFRKKKIFEVALYVSAVALILAQSEGAAIGAAAAILMLGLSERRSRKAIIVGFVTALIIAMVLPTRAKVIENLSLKGWSGRVRTEMWSETWNMLKDHALLGAGLSGYPIVFKPYHRAGHIEIFQYPHDIFLNFWSELGLAGALMLVWLALLIIKTYKRGDAMSLAIIAAFVAILVHGLVDVPYFKNDLAMLWWLLLAMLVSIRAETKKAEH